MSGARKMAGATAPTAARIAGEPDALLHNLVVFARLLRRAGLAVGVEQEIDLARTVEWIDLGDRAQFFHAARSLLVSRREHLRLFETIFHRFWSADLGKVAAGQRAPVAPRHDPREPRPFNVVTYMAYKARRFDREVEVADRAGSFSAEEALQNKDFSLLTPEELESVRRLIRKMRWRVSRRLTRRWVDDDRGSVIHLRRVLREVGKRGCLPAALAYRARKVKQRPVVLLADVSGSMEKYARLVLQFFHSASQSLDAVECFTFGTRLTRLTPQLRIRNIDRALDEAARQVIDWSGGTRIGAAFGEFNRRWSRRVLRRGAIVVVISDGWERGDAARLGREMRHLQRRCHRLLWLNPLSGRPSYQPVVEGMAAALPYVDDFLPIHNLQSLDELADRLACVPARRSARGSGERLRNPPEILEEGAIE